MRVIAKPTLINFWERHPDAKEPLNAWFHLMRHRDYATPNQLKAEIGSASLIENNHVVFNFGGNKYRLVVKVNYRLGIMYVRRVLTHEEYDAHIASGTLVEWKAR